jgi:hypothetical protein
MWAPSRVEHMLCWCAGMSWCVEWADAALHHLVEVLACVRVSMLSVGEFVCMSA